MSKFTIIVNDDVSVAPLAKTLAANGYTLKGIPNESSVELAETPERKAQIDAAVLRDRERRRFMDMGLEP